jgi:hypothetical protein
MPIRDTMGLWSYERKQILSEKGDGEPEAGVGDGRER